VAEQASSSLAGKRVVITRAERQSAALAAALHEKGATTILLPLIQIFPPQDFSSFDAALLDLGNFDWLILTSQNAVAAVVDRLAALGIGERGQLKSAKIAAVGKITSEAAIHEGLAVAYTGKGGTAADLVRELANEFRGKRVFLPRSDRSAAALVNQLRALDAQVTEAVAYHTRNLDSVSQSTRQAIADGDAILFFSPSAVHAFHTLLKSGVLSSLRGDVAIGAIGPVTQSALFEAGMRCDFQALQPSVNEIVAALATHFEAKKVSSISGAISQ